MRCATCGDSLTPGMTRCPTCGAAQGNAWVTSSPAHQGGGTGAGLTTQRCPRCGYRGEGISYFSRPGHVGLLIGVSLFTYGIGGGVYWLARRNHRICPSCGLGWEYAGQDGGSPGALATTGGGGSSFPAKLPSAGTKRRVLGSALVLLASFLIMMGILEFEAAAMVVGSVMGAGGSGMFFWGWKSLQERRQAITTGMQQDVLRLAEQRGGSLTVTEVAANLNVSIPAAEKLLMAMDDGFRVRSEITDEGVIIYEFPEVRHRRQIEGGPQA